MVQLQPGGGPQHWFRQEWILKAEEHKALHLHFTMEDNPALDEGHPGQIPEHVLCRGVLHQRYILGLWVMSEGAYLDMFDQTENVYRTQERPVDLEWVSQRTVACDYGTANPTVFLDIYDHDGVIRVGQGVPLGQPEGAPAEDRPGVCRRPSGLSGQGMVRGDRRSSAASFIEELRRRGCMSSLRKMRCWTAYARPEACFTAEKFWSVKPVPACWTNWAPICGTRRRASGGMRSPWKAGPRAGRPALLHQFTAGLEVRVSVQTQ